MRAVAVTFSRRPDTGCRIGPIPTPGPALANRHRSQQLSHRRSARPLHRCRRPVRTRRCDCRLDEAVTKGRFEELDGDALVLAHSSERTHQVTGFDVTASDTRRTDLRPRRPSPLPQPPQRRHRIDISSQSMSRLRASHRGLRRRTSHRRWLGRSRSAGHQDPTSPGCQHDSIPPRP